MRYVQFFKSAIVCCAMAIAGCGGEQARSDHEQSDAPAVKGLKTPAAFESIENDQDRAAAVFGEMMKVIAHPRCANCHPVTGGPTQGDDMHPHEPPVIRGMGMGADAMGCDTCHGTQNTTFASMTGSIPGAQPWMLAPQSMGWQGKSASEVCAQLKDPDRNGGRSLEDLIAHNGEDHLVDWAWNPGEGREPAPGDQKVFGALTAAWVEAGAHCPAE